MLDFDIEIAARTLWMEARGEQKMAQEAVAHVLWNRTRDGRWGKTLTSVCLWPYQFSSWNTNDPNRRGMSQLSQLDNSLANLVAIIERAQEPHDLTNGATHYYACTIPEPAWVKGATYCGQFGKQKFYKDVK